MATNVPRPTLSATGYVAPSEQAVLTGVQTDINAAFGGGLNPGLSTPQGQLASSMAAIIGNANDTFVDVTNQINPDYARGRWQDAIGEIYFLQRDPSEPTVVQAVCAGGDGVVIPAGAQAEAEDGNIYTCTEGGVISGGTVTLPFACPYPTYEVSFERPGPLPILFAVSIANNEQVPADAVTLVQNAIIAAFAGADGGTRASIGSTIYASRFYSAVALLGPWAQIISLLIGSSNNSAAEFVGSIAGATLTVSSVASGAIAIGQTVTDDAGAVLPGTKIVSGGGTSWQVSTSQTVASTTLYGTVPTRTVLDADIDQVPTINSNNIAVTIV